MKGTMTVIQPNGTLTTYPLKGVPDHTRISAAINGGLIQLVPYFSRYDGKDCVAFCNEEGKLNHLPLNASATALWAAQLDVPLVDYLVGPVVIISGDAELLRRL